MGTKASQSAVSQSTAPKSATDTDTSKAVDTATASTTDQDQAGSVNGASDASAPAVDVSAQTATSESDAQLQAIDSVAEAAPSGLWAALGAAIKISQKNGDHAGYALLNDLEIRFGEIKMRLPTSTDNLSDEVAEFVDKLKASF